MSKWKVKETKSACEEWVPTKFWKGQIFFCCCLFWGRGVLWLSGKILTYLYPLKRRCYSSTYLDIRGHDISAISEALRLTSPWRVCQGWCSWSQNGSPSPSQAAATGPSPPALARNSFIFISQTVRFRFSFVHQQQKANFKNLDLWYRVVPYLPTFLSIPVLM